MHYTLLISILLYTLSSSCFAIHPIIKNHTPKRIALFNGKDLSGWQHVGEGSVEIENGLLKTQSGMGLLWYSKKKLGNVLIRVVYKTTYPDSNSGIFVRIHHEPKNAWDAVHHGYEIQICNEGKDAPDAYHQTGAIFSFSKALRIAAKPQGEWNQYDIALQGERIIIWLNGIKVNEFDPQTPVPKRNRNEPKRGKRPIYGYIGIQNHDHHKEKDNHVYFKEISFIPLKTI